MIMWNFGNSGSQRSSDSRRKSANGPSPWIPRFRAILGWPLVIAAAFWALATFIVISGDEPLTYSVGQILKRPVLSRVDFQRVNQFQTEELRRKTRQGVPNYFRLDKALVDTIQAEFRDLHAAVKASENFESYQKTNPDRWELDEQAFTVLKSVTDQAGSEQFKRNVDALASRLINEEMIERAEVERDIRSTASNVMLDRGDGVFRPVPKERLNYASNPRDVEELASRLIRYVFPDEIRQVLENIIIKSISPDNQEFKPLYVFDAPYTKDRLVEADHVEPVMDKYKAGDRMIKAGKIDREALALLKIEHQEYLKQRSVNAELRAQWRNKRIGLLGVIMLVTIGLTIFTIHTQPRIVRKAPRSLAVAGLLLLMLLFERFILLQVTDSPIWSVTAVTMTAAILTIAYSQVFAFGATSALAILSVLALSAPYSLIVVLLSATTITVLMLREVRTRLKMLAVGAITAAVASFSALLIALSDGQDVGADVVYAAPAALAGLTLVNILLPVIEMAFRITTSQTLLEWADTSQPHPETTPRKGARHLPAQPASRQHGRDRVGGNRSQRSPRTRRRLLPRHRKDLQASLFRRKPGGQDQRPFRSSTHYEPPGHPRPRQRRAGPRPRTSPATRPPPLHRRAPRNHRRQILPHPGDPGSQNQRSEHPRN